MPNNISRMKFKPINKDRPSKEIPICPKSVAIHKMIVPGAIGAPKDKTNTINKRIAISLPPSVTPQILAKNKLTIERHTQVPSIFIVAPRGITKEDTF